MIIVGITGSIGMGKTTVASMLRVLCIPVFDSDKKVKNILEKNHKVIEKINNIWPEAVHISECQKIINKLALSDIIFNNIKNKKKLEKIIHPIVQKERNLFLKKHKDSKIVALDVPLLYETGSNKICDYVFLVNTSLEIQKKRVLSRENMTETKFDLINNSQWDFKRKKKKHPYVVNTSFGIIFSFFIILYYLLIVIICGKKND